MDELNEEGARAMVGERQTMEELELPARLDNLQRVQEFLQGAFERTDCPPAEQYQLSVALEEMFVNVCHYAYANEDEPGYVRVGYACRIDPPKVTVRIVDSGVPFDPVAYDPVLPTNVKTAKIGGLGVYMSRKFMDDFTYARVDGCNVVTFSKCW